MTSKKEGRVGSFFVLVIGPAWQCRSAHSSMYFETPWGVDTNSFMCAGLVSRRCR